MENQRRTSSILVLGLAKFDCFNSRECYFLLVPQALRHRGLAPCISDRSRLRNRFLSTPGQLYSSVSYPLMIRTVQGFANPVDDIP